jgi:hypothetical protein
MIKNSQTIAPSAPAQAAASTTTTTTTTTEAESLQIRRAQWQLQDLDDREAWQEDFVAALLKKLKPKSNVHYLAHGKFQNLRSGIDTLFRCFDIRGDFSYRHRAKFDVEGFYIPDASEFYFDYWWVNYSWKGINVTKPILIAAGFLEQRDLGLHPADPETTRTSLRLRADLMVDLLKGFDPVKYADLNY